MEERQSPWYRYLYVVEVEENRPVVDHKGRPKIFGVFEVASEIGGFV